MHRKEREKADMWEAYRESFFRGVRVVCIAYMKISLCSLEDNVKVELRDVEVLA